MSERTRHLERRRLWLISQANRERRRLVADGQVALHWIHLARMLAIAARRAASLYRYTNHSTQP
ncbi:MAG: hypothetical protein ACRET4_07575 [Steroidobacteraceae bacterium]